MTLAATLIVTVLAVGGPHGTKPFVPKHATITIRHSVVAECPPGADCFPPHPPTVRQSHNGRLTAQLAPGGYFVEASLAASGWQTCGATNVTLKSGKTTRITLRCSIK